MKKLSMQVVNPESAGIDVGSRFHMVAVDQNPDNVKKFGVYTKDHNEMVAWFEKHGIKSVAMESTGSYWQTLFDALQRAGLEVILVNGNQIKNVKGKKTDVLDCLWIQKLHSLGLLKGSFLPTSEIQSLRTYFNHRQHMINQCSRYINKIQKALRLMNIRIDLAVSDIMGKSGRAIIEGILSGEKDSKKLAALADYRVRKSREEIAQSLEGNHREDLLFEARSNLALYDMYCAKIKECDQHLEEKIKEILLGKQAKQEVKSSLRTKKQINKHDPKFDIEGLCEQYYGVNLMTIPGVGRSTILCLLTYLGGGIYQFPTAKHLCSWLRLAPNNKVSGGNLISSRTPKGKNRVSLALRQAANTVTNQKDGEMVRFFKKVAFKKGRGSAITATARKLAVIIYNMITKKQNYGPADASALSMKAKNRILRDLRKKVETLGLTQNQLAFLLAPPDSFTAT